MICWPTGAKCPGKDVQKAIRTGTSYLDRSGETPVSRYS